jgi:hypothetical protein
MPAKKANLAADYRFFDVPQPFSPSENQVFRRLLALSGFETKNLGRKLRTANYFLPLSHFAF